MAPAELRWVCLLPDPVTGLDQPVPELSGKPKIWVAPNREYAVRLVRADLMPKAFRLASVVSMLDWESRRSQPQRAKLSHEPVHGHRFVEKNPERRCIRCGKPTHSTPYALYCRRCRLHGKQPKKSNTAHPDAHAD